MTTSQYTNTYVDNSSATNAIRSESCVSNIRGLLEVTRSILLAVAKQEPSNHSREWLEKARLILQRVKSLSRYCVVPEAMTDYSIAIRRIYDRIGG